MTPDEFRAIVADLRVSQTHVAKCLGVDARTVRHWMHGDQPIPETIARVLRLSASGDCVLEMLGHFASAA